MEGELRRRTRWKEKEEKGKERVKRGIQRDGRKWIGRKRKGGEREREGDTMEVEGRKRKKRKKRRRKEKEKYEMKGEVRQGV